MRIFKETETSYDPYKKLAPNEGDPVYSKLIGSLTYAMCCTRLDIAFTVSILSRFTGNPSKEH